VAFPGVAFIAKGDSSMKLLFGAIVGALAAWLYRSDRARQEIQQRLADAPNTLQQVKQSVGSAAGSGAERVGDAVGTADVPDPVKDAASKATAVVQSAADQGNQPASPDTGAPGRPGGSGPATPAGAETEASAGGTKNPGASSEPNRQDPGAP